MAVPTGVTYDYPSAEELREIEQELLPAVVDDDPIFDEFPMVDSDFDRLIWEQKDNFQGVQQPRGLEGTPKSVKRVGNKDWDVEPGVYGEFAEISEKEMTERRKLGSWDKPVNIDDLVGDAQALLLQRRVDRIRLIIWTLLTTGAFSVFGKDGKLMHRDTFALKSINSSVAWTTYATAVPSTDLRAAQLLSLGQSVDFGVASEIWMNRPTSNALLSNTNPSDLFGRRINGGATSNSLKDWNDWAESNDLPRIRVYDRSYIDDAGVAQRFIPTGKAVLIGRRTNGARLGEYRMTRNANNPKMEAGPYTRVIDYGEISVPRKLHVHDGHNGGPAIFFPGAIVTMNLF